MKNWSVRKTIFRNCQLNLSINLHKSAILSLFSESKISSKFHILLGYEHENSLKNRRSVEVNMVKPDPEILILWRELFTFTYCTSSIFISRIQDLPLAFMSENFSVALFTNWKWIDKSIKKLTVWFNLKITGLLFIDAR